MTIKHQSLTPDFSVAPQLAPNDVSEIARMGFRSIINNRPDGEGGPDQPRDEEMRAAAQAAGLRYEFLPVAPSANDPEAIERTRQLLKELPQPVLAFCRTGTRSTKLFQAATQ